MRFAAVSPYHVTSSSSLRTVSIAIFLASLVHGADPNHILPHRFFSALLAGIKMANLTPFVV